MFRKICKSFAVFLLAFAFDTNAQKNIVLDDSLAANAEQYNVKVGAKWIGKMYKLKFGSYAVVSSKAGWVTNSQRGNFWNTRTESKMTQKFSFVISDGSVDSVNVNAANNIETQAFREFAIYFGVRDETDWILKESKNFSAYIHLNKDTSDTWYLLMKTTEGARADSKYEAILSNGKRTIYIDPITSNRKGEDKRNFHALGYEFVEGDRAISALQYYGGGALGTNKNMVWLHKALESKMKLILAAAMTTILEIKIPEFE